MNNPGYAHFYGGPLDDTTSAVLDLAGTLVFYVPSREGSVADDIERIEPKRVEYRRVFVDGNYAEYEFVGTE